MHMFDKIMYTTMFVLCAAMSFYGHHCPIEKWPLTTAEEKIV